MHMYATAYPDKNRSNSPVYFFSPDGKTWNGSPEPYPATHNDEVEIVGYETGERKNFNGANYWWIKFLPDMLSKCLLGRIQISWFYSTDATIR